MDVMIVLLHGLGATPITLWPLEAYLKWCGHESVRRVAYPVDRLSTDDAVLYVSRRLAEMTDARDIVVVGQSMGGVVANRLHRHGWNVLLGVYIGSPLHGARALRQIQATVPTAAWRWIHKPPYDYLMTKPREAAPPHPVETISMGWGWSSFDGCVYRDEATLDPAHHQHLSWADHRTVFANPRLWRRVQRTIAAHLTPRLCQTAPP